MGEMSFGSISRTMQPDYFYRFLKYSPNTPQWYGYTRQNRFAVRREFEDELYLAVKNGLENDFVRKNGYHTRRFHLLDIFVIFLFWINTIEVDMGAISPHAIQNVRQILR